MKITIPIGLTLLLTSGMALAWQPVVYPIRSQSTTQQNIDAAMCYSVASKQTNVNITREAQAPMAPKPAPAQPGSGSQQAGQPPLPASGVASASGTLAGAPAAASAGMGKATTAKGTPATPAMPDSDSLAKTDKNGASDASGASDAQGTTEAEVKLPPPPPPEPPMTRYWRAYGVCMQGRGYAVQ